MLRLVASLACAAWISAASPAFADPADFIVRVVVQDGATPRQISGVLAPNGQVLTSSSALITEDSSEVRVSAGGASLPVQNIRRQGSLAVLSVTGLTGASAIAAAQDLPNGERLRIFWATAAGNDSRQEFVTPSLRWDAIPGSALGGAIVNECDQIIGIVAPRGNQRAVTRATAQGSPGPLSVQGISRSSLGLLPRAEAPCTPAAAAEAPADTADEATVDDAARANDEANQRVADLQAQLNEAQRGSAQAQRLQRDLEEAQTRQAESASALERAQAEAEGAGELAERERAQKERVSQLARYGAIGGLLLIVIVGAISALLLMRARRRTGDAERDRDQLAEKDRRRSNAPDWILVGDKTRLKLRGALMADENRGAVVGRGQSEADVLVESEQISRRHARFILRGGGIFVEDLASLNGTTVNGRRLASGETTEVREGDRVDFAGKSFTLQRA